MTIDLIEKYFTLNNLQRSLFLEYVDLLLEWNKKINLISRQDEPNIWLHHILHSLAIAKVVNLTNLDVIDVGTGGGLPGIPLAIIFPQAKFTLLDSIAKKINALKDIVNKLELTNVQLVNQHSKQYKEKKFDFVVARAVSNLRKFYRLTKHLIQPGKKTNLSNGIIYLKGGEIQEETKIFGSRVKIFNISDYFDEIYFKTKKIVYIKF